MQHHFEPNLVPFENAESAIQEDPNRAALELFAGPRRNFVYYCMQAFMIAFRAYLDRELKLTA